MCPIRPVMWNSGAMPNTDPPGAKRAQSRYSAAVKTTFRCVFIAPLGTPVVPEV